MISLSRVIAFALIIGLLVGLLETSFLEAMRRGGPTPHGAGALWMAPVADAILLLVCAVGCYVVGRWIPALRRGPVLVGVVCGTGALALLLAFSGIHVLALLVLAAGVGDVAGRRSARGGGLDSALRPGALALVGGVFALALLLRLPGGVEGPAGHQGSGVTQSGAEKPPNVLLIILDTVRAKSLGLYGRELETSPFLDRWAEEGTVFGRALATAPWTLPSHASMFTGQQSSMLSTHFLARLDGTYPTLAEELSAQGYATGGFVGNLLFASRYSGLARGFHEYDDFPVSIGQTVLSVAWGRRLAASDLLRNRLGAHELLNRKSAASIIDRFLSWREDVRESGDAPYFAFLNLFDAHEPYLPPEPFDRRFAPDRSRGDLLHVVSLWGGNEAIRPMKWEMSETDRELDLGLYEGGIAYIDSELERLFGTLAERGDLDETLVIVTSDHGEQFGEHGLYRHINSVYMPLLHIPLIVRYPERVPAGTRVDVPVSLRQIPATVIDLLDLRSTATFPGPSLARAWSEGAAPPAFSELRPGLVEREWYPVAGGPLYSLVEGSLHYIRSEEGHEELYDLSLDPDELTNLVDHADYLDDMERMAAVVDSLLAERPEELDIDES